MVKPTARSTNLWARPWRRDPDGEMTGDGVARNEPTGLGRELRTPRAAAIAGILFALILGTVIVLMSSAFPQDAKERVAWITNASGRGSVALAIKLIPFAGIAFLWFIGVIRNRLGDREDKLFATVFLGSGLLLVGTLFTAAAVVGSVLLTYEEAPTISPDTLRIAEILATTLLGTFATKMAAVFTLAVTTVGLRTQLVPRWLSVIGVGCAVALLLTPPAPKLTLLVFPLWVLILSLHILVLSIRSQAPLAGDNR
ncbi:MAG: hypothetical protein ABI662_03225 [Dermatophilaceae bacterium]